MSGMTGPRLLGVGLPLSAAASVASLGLLRVRYSGSPDASFYLGHVVDLAGQAARYGQTYHGNRVSYILVDRWFVATFGLESGLLLARHLMLALAVLAAFTLGARWAGPASGAVVAASVAFVPWLPRELMWTFYDGFAATYLLAAAALLLVPSGRRARAVGELAAGVLFAAAINANLALAAVAAITGVSWWVFRAEDGPRRLVSATARLVVGWAALSGLLALFLRSIYPDGVAFPELVALRVGFDVLATDQYFTPLRELGWRLGHLVPVVAVALGLTVLLVRHDPRDDARALVRAAAVQIGGVGALALTLHLVTRDTWFGAPYYTIYHLPGTVVGLAAILAAVVRRTGVRTPAPAMWGVVAVVAVWFALLPLPGTVVRPVAALGLGAALLVPVAVAVTRPRSGRGVIVAVPILLLLAGLGTTASAWHAGSDDGWGDVATRNAAELDLIRHGAALKSLVEGAVAPDERLQFWHTTQGRDGEVLRRLNMVFYGTGEGRLHTKGGPGMPTLSEGELAGLRDDPPVVVLLATSPTAVVAGEVALRIAGLRPVLRTDAELDGEVLDVTVRILDVGGGHEGRP